MKSRKRLFLGLFLLASIILLILSVFFVYFIQAPHALVFQYSFLVIILALMGVTAVSFLVLGFMLFSVLKGTSFPILNRVVEKGVVFMYPLILHLGRAMRITQDIIQKSFIDVNNKLVEARKIQVKPQEVLLLLPHCLQDDGCPHKITGDPFNCNRCGKCPVSGVLDVVEKWQIQVKVVSGGTLARRAVKIFRPRCIVAVACERDLSSGILDSFPLPVYGVLNDRPYGPCYNTRVSIELLEENLRNIMEHNKPAGQARVN